MGFKKAFEVKGRFAGSLNANKKNHFHGRATNRNNSLLIMKAFTVFLLF
jgi:hypothetical protein